MWEQEFVVADCADGDEARTVMDLISRALADGAAVLDLRGIERADSTSSAAAN